MGYVGAMEIYLPRSINLSARTRLVTLILMRPRKVSNYINESLTRSSFYSFTTTAKIITTAINNNAKQSYI